MMNDNKNSSSRAGMMGDGTEEQKLGQPGAPNARNGKDEVEEAFGKGKGEASHSQGDVTDQVSNDASDAKATPEDKLPKDNSHNFT